MWKFRKRGEDLPWQLLQFPHTLRQGSSVFLCEGSNMPWWVKLINSSECTWGIYLFFFMSWTLLIICHHLSQFIFFPLIIISEKGIWATPHLLAIKQCFMLDHNSQHEDPCKNFSTIQHSTLFFFIDDQPREKSQTYLQICGWCWHCR